MSLIPRLLKTYWARTRNRPKDNSLAWWKQYVGEFFAPSGIYRISVANLKVFQTSLPAPLSVPAYALPRFFQLKYDSGVTEELLILGDVSEQLEEGGTTVIRSSLCREHAVFDSFTIVEYGNLGVIFGADGKLQLYEFEVTGFDLHVDHSVIHSDLQHMSQALIGRSTMLSNLSLGMIEAAAAAAAAAAAVSSGSAGGAAAAPTAGPAAGGTSAIPQEACALLRESQTLIQQTVAALRAYGNRLEGYLSSEWNFIQKTLQHMQMADAMHSLGDVMGQCARQRGLMPSQAMAALAEPGMAAAALAAPGAETTCFGPGSADGSAAAAAAALLAGRADLEAAQAALVVDAANRRQNLSLDAGPGSGQGLSSALGAGVGAGAGLGPLGAGVGLGGGSFATAPQLPRQVQAQSVVAPGQALDALLPRRLQQMQQMQQLQPQSQPQPQQFLGQVGLGLPGPSNLASLMSDGACPVGASSGIDLRLLLGGPGPSPGQMVGPGFTAFSSASGAASATAAAAAVPPPGAAAAAGLAQPARALQGFSAQASFRANLQPYDGVGQLQLLLQQQQQLQQQQKLQQQARQRQQEQQLQLSSLAVTGPSAGAAVSVSGLLPLQSWAGRAGLGAGGSATGVGAGAGTGYGTAPRAANSVTADNDSLDGLNNTGS